MIHITYMHFKTKFGHVSSPTSIQKYYTRHANFNQQEFGFLMLKKGMRKSHFTKAFHFDYKWNHPTIKLRAVLHKQRKQLIIPLAVPVGNVKRILCSDWLPHVTRDALTRAALSVLLWQIGRSDCNVTAKESFSKVVNCQPYKGQPNNHT